MDAVKNVEARFNHLLQPIRDLTKNWEIDVAAELADYLEELDEMVISFDGGKTTLNFAQAALLIQGSTSIYSKKVEYLYNLVFLTLEFIAERKKKKDNQGEGEGEEGDEQDGGRPERKARKQSHTDDAEMEEARNDITQAISTKIERTSFDSTKDPTNDTTDNGDQCTDVKVVPLPPSCLMAPESREKQMLPLISLRGEVLCSCKDFRINLFIPDESGIIRLFKEGFQAAFLKDMTEHSMLAPVNLFGDEDMAVADGPQVGGDDGGDDGMENLPPLADVQDDDMEGGAEEHIDRQRATMPSPNRVLRERQPLQEVQNKHQEGQNRLQQGAQPPDPWKFHDLYEEFGLDKPRKTGKCYKMPPGVDEYTGKRKRKGSSALQDFWTFYSGTYDPPESKLKNGPSSTDMNYIYLSKMKDKMKNRRRILRKSGVFVSEEEMRRTLLEKGDGKPEDEQGFHNLHDADDDLSDNEHEPLGCAEGGDAPDFAPLALDLDVLSYEDLLKKRVEEQVLQSQAYAQETALSKRVKEWNDKIQPLLRIQETLPAMDIHDYGDRVVQALDNVGRRRSLASIVYGMQNYDACKFMLASLQLANDYTVEIDSKDATKDLERSVDTMGLTLLNTNRASDRFNTLQPTAANGRPDDVRDELVDALS